jgi:hypothetical protein
MPVWSKMNHNQAKDLRRRTNHEIYKVIWVEGTKARPYGHWKLSQFMRGCGGYTHYVTVDKLVAEDRDSLEQLARSNRVTWAKKEGYMQSYNTWSREGEIVIRDTSIEVEATH